MRGRIVNWFFSSRGFLKFERRKILSPSTAKKKVCLKCKRSKLAKIKKAKIFLRVLKKKWKKEEGENGGVIRHCKIGSMSWRWKFFDKFYLFFFSFLSRFSRRCEKLENCEEKNSAKKTRFYHQVGIRKKSFSQFFSLLQSNWSNRLDSHPLT